MFDQTMWIAYLSVGITSGLLGMMSWQLATRDERSANSQHLIGTVLLAVGAVCAWLSPVVGLPAHTTHIVILSATIVVVTTLIVLVTQRAAFNKRIRMQAALRRGR